MSDKEWHQNAIIAFENKIENLQKAFDKLKKCRK